MKKTLKAVVIALGTMLSTIGNVSAQGTDTLRLSLSDALKIALSENPTIKIAEEEIKKSEYAKKGTYAALYPQLEFSTSYQRAIQKQTFVMGDQRVKVGTTNNINTGFSGTMPVISATLWQSLKLSALDVELAVEKARSSRIDMVEQVTNTYYAILLAKDSYNVFIETYNNAVTNHENIRQKYEAELTSEYDFIRSGVTVKNIESSVYDAQNAIELAKWQLKALMGIDLNLPIACDGSLNDFDALMNERSIHNGSLEANSSLLQLDIQELQLARTLKMKKLEYAPKLNLSASYVWTAMSNSFQFAYWNPYSVAGLSLSVPIFSGGKRYTDIKQAQINLRQIALQREETERNLNVAVLNYQSSMQTSIKQFTAACSGVEEAEKGYSISVKRYELGSGTLVDVNDSQLALTRALLTRNQSIYNFLIAQTSLEKVYGTHKTDNLK